MNYLRQTTAATIALGPFVDSTNATTLETGLTILQADVRLKKGNGDFAQKSSATTLTYNETGFYDCGLTTTDTNTAGRLKIAVNEAGALPVWDDYFVLPANVYDSLVGSDYLDINAVQINGSSVATATAQIGVNVVQFKGVTQSAFNIAGEIGTNGSGLSSIPWNAGWDAEIESEVNDAITSHATINAILNDTNELQTDWVNGGRLDLILDARSSQASLSLVDSLVDAIKAKTDLLGFTGSNVNASIGATTVNANIVSSDITLTASIGTINNVLNPVTIASNATINSILADTNELQTDWANTGRLDTILDARASQASLSSIDVLVDAIKVITDQINFTSTKVNAYVGATTVNANIVSSSITLTASVGTVNNVINPVSIVSNATINAILADTNELQTAWVDGGRLDNILDARASASSITLVRASISTVNSSLTSINAAMASVDDTILNSVVDGTRTVKKALQIRLAKDIGRVVVSGNTFAYYDQSGNVLVTDPHTLTGATRTVA